jgi:hypothetical protein
MWSQTRTILKAPYSRLYRREQIGLISEASLPPIWFMQPRYGENPTKQAISITVALPSKGRHAHLTFILFVGVAICTGDAAMQMQCCVENYVTTDHQIRSLPSRQQ